MKLISNWVVMGKIAEANIGNAKAKLVLMRMAFAINTKRGDFVVWESIGHIARDTHLSRSTVQRAQRYLEDEGLIAVVNSAHQWHTTRWRIEVDTIDALKFPKYRVSARRPNVAETWTMKDERGAREEEGRAIA
jgi:hypothetical protein